MSRSAYPDGTLVLDGSRLGRVVRAAKAGGAPGYLVSIERLAPGDGYLPHWTPPSAIRLPVIGETVCPNPAFPLCICRCWCGLVHLPLDQLAQLGG